MIISVPIGLTALAVTAAPAMATAECAEVDQIVSRAAGTWTLTDGPLVQVEAVDSGIAWVALDGATLGFVHMETVPTTIGDTSVSAAVTLPGSASGTMPIAGDDDLSIRFVGHPACQGDDHGDAVIEVEELVVETVEKAASTVTAEAVTPLESASITFAPQVRHLCRFVTYAA